MGRIKIGRVMCHSPEIVDQYAREKAADLWLRDLMHYVHDTGKYASRKCDLLRKYHPDRDYICTIGKDERGNPFCRYDLLPISMHGHRVDIVYYDIEVNPDGSRVKYPSGIFHCIDCKLMGTVKTMKEYICFGSTKIDWMKDCGCSQCKCGGEPCTWATVSRICHKT